MDVLHDKGIKTVVISSSDLGGNEYLIGYGSVNSGKYNKIDVLKPMFASPLVKFLSCKCRKWLKKSN